MVNRRYANSEIQRNDLFYLIKNFFHFPINQENKKSIKDDLILFIEISDEEFEEKYNSQLEEISDDLYEIVRQLKDDILFGLDKYTFGIVMDKIDWFRIETEYFEDIINLIKNLLL